MTHYNFTDRLRRGLHIARDEAARLQHGFDEVIEVKSATGYWRYQFPDFPAPMEIGLQRDKVLREIFRRTNQR